MPSNQKSLLRLVEREIFRCRLLALHYFRSASLQVERKPDRSPVTVADRLIEERLRHFLAKAFPGEAIIGEELGGSGRAGGTYWTIDPIDGTRAFSRGLPSWGIMVGKVESGRAVLGVCDFPAIATTIAAAAGIAPYERTRGKVIPLPRPRRVNGLEEAVIFHGGARWWLPTPYHRGFNRIISDCYLERAYGDCYGYLWALRGFADAVLDYGVKRWDMVPLAAIAQATGRVLVDFNGQPSFIGPDTLMAHPFFARTLVQILKAKRQK